VEAIIPLSFTAELAQLSARQFANLLKKYLRMRGLVLGADFALGKDREGDADTLRRLGEDMDFTVTVILPIMVNGEVVSSTAIRNALANGDMKKVLQLIGRPFSLNGRVIKGTGRGTELGFPTANLDIDPMQALPADGVYATWSHIDTQIYQSMTNIGKQLTFGGGQRTIEVYILDYHDNLYGHELTIDLMKRLRGEKQFGTAEELKKQISEDIKQGRAILTSQARG
jgi:riboflavin kinase/FMN adenylyltransferase